MGRRVEKGKDRPSGITMGTKVIRIQNEFL